MIEREMEMLAAKEIREEHLEVVGMIASLLAALVDRVLGEPHRCAICGIPFACDSNLQIHISRMHTVHQVGVYFGKHNFYYILALHYGLV